MTEGFLRYKVITTYSLDFFNCRIQ